MPIYFGTAAQIREIDRMAIEDYGIAGTVLMENAGRGAVSALLQRAPRLDHATVVCGPGNNGGDGFVISRYLLGCGIEVTTVLLGSADKVSGDALINLNILRKMNHVVHAIEDPAQIDPHLQNTDVVVDAMLGTGLRSAPRAPFDSVIRKINDCSAWVMAVDLPSGLDSDSGSIFGDAVQANFTATFAFPKAGLVSAPGFKYAGDIAVIDIGVPPGAITPESMLSGALLDAVAVAPLLAPFDLNGHKGVHGHVLAVAGSPDKSGAALLVGEGALRSGCGLCTLAGTFETTERLAEKTRELMTVELGRAFDKEAARRCIELSRGKDCIVCGPGIPVANQFSSRAFLTHLLRESQLPLVLDADAINLLAEHSELLKDAPSAVLTPHPKEMARLCGATVDQVQANRAAMARDFAAEHGVVVVLKGARTVVTDGQSLWINTSGNPGMGTAGTGDVLAGMIGGMIAQGLTPGDAARAAVFCHGRAGDIAAAKLGQRSIVASDLLAQIGPAYCDTVEQAERIAPQLDELGRLARDASFAREIP